METFQGRGSFVLEVPGPVELREVRTHQDVLELMDFRIGVESEAAGLVGSPAYGNSTQRDRARPRRLPSGRRRSRARSVEADFAFHLAVALASGNRFYGEAIRELGPMMIMLPRTRLDPAYEMSDPDHLTRVIHEHENIHTAIVHGDGEAARAAMRVHLTNTRRRLGA